MGVGAGPYYGLLNLSEIQRELDYRCWSKQAIGPPSPSSRFPFTRQDAVDVCRRLNADEKATRITAAYPCNGCIPICFHGCAMSSWIVVTGELRGSVWDVANDVRSEGLWLPAGCPTGIRPHVLRRCNLTEDGFKERSNLKPITTFHDWFNRWLDRCLADLNLIHAASSLAARDHS